MKHRLLFSLVLLASAALVPPAAAQHAGPAAPDTAAPDSAQVVSVVQDFRRALAAGDSAAVAGLLHPEAVVLESGGLETKREYLGHHFHADHASLSELSTTTVKQRVRVAGDVAWVSSARRMKGAYDGRDLDRSSAELMVLRRSEKDSAWKISAIHWSSRSRE